MSNTSLPLPPNWSFVPSGDDWTGNAYPEYWENEETGERVYSLDEVFRKPVQTILESDDRKVVLFLRGDGKYTVSLGNFPVSIKRDLADSTEMFYNVKYAYAMGKIAQKYPDKA